MPTSAVTVTPPWPSSRQEAVFPTQWSQKVGHMSSNQSSRYKMSGRMKRRSYLPPTGSAELGLQHPVNSPRSKWAGKMTEKSFELELTGRGKRGVVRTLAFSVSKGIMGTLCISTGSLSNLRHLNCSRTRNFISLKKKNNRICVFLVQNMQLPHKVTLQIQENKTI